MKHALSLGCCLLAAAASFSKACDLCTVYNASAARGQGNIGLNLSLVEQFTHSGTLQENGSETADPIGQYRDSSLTSLILGYNFHRRASVSLSIPYIHRAFKRAEGFEVERGTEAGLGDVTLVGRWVVLFKPEHEFSYAVSLLGGVEFPTGDSDRLREEVNEVDVPGAPPSGVHGDDLTLGSGSFDGVVGVSASAGWQRWLVTADAQYFIRTEGDFDYKFGNELSVSAGPGFYLLFDENRTLALQAVVGYETKGRDSIDGDKRDEGIASAWYAGPGITLTWGERFSATLNADLPLQIANRSFQTVPDYRVRGGVSWHF
jgi:hypothetical protein